MQSIGVGEHRGKGNPNSTPIHYYYVVHVLLFIALSRHQQLLTNELPYWDAKDELQSALEIKGGIYFKWSI